MSDLKWFSRWNRENPKDVIGPAFLAGTVGVAILVAAGLVVWGYPFHPTTIQTGPRGTGMEVARFPTTDPTIENIYTEPAIKPVGGEQLARDIYPDLQVLGDLTEDNFNRLMNAMTEWVAPEQGCAFCHGEEGDFASDAVYAKVVSRRMIEMTRDINASWTDHVAPAGVTCFTCHRGQNVPSNVWFDITPLNGTMIGWAANQNQATSLSQSTSLPSDALQKYLVEYEPIRVTPTVAQEANADTASIQQTERTFSLMNYFSNALGVNCTYCHNTRALGEIDQSTPQQQQALLGIGMSLSLNNDYLLPLAGILPPERLGKLHADGPKVGCATCHKGFSKPLQGHDVISDWPELATDGTPAYE